MTKILLVEDDKSLREIYGVRLQAEGYEIVSAGDGEEALAMAIKERPALIVSDVMMPKISGFDMLDILRSTTETKDVKVIMMTALSSDDQRARGEALGADRYLVKSQVGIEDVVRTVHDVLGDGIPAPAAAPTFPPVSTPAPAPAAPLTPAPTPEPLAAMPAPAPAPAPVEPLPTISLPPTPEVAPAPVAPAEPAAAVAPEPIASPAPAPVAPVEPPVINMPTPETPQAPVMPDMQTAPVEPVAPAAPAMPAPAAPTPDVGLPAPTAPFSTPRPASLGDRVINPLPSADNLSSPAGDLAAQMNQELNSLNTPPQPPTPPVPPAPGI